MKKKAIVVSLSIALLAFAWVGAVYAQGDTGYPIDDETPVPTETKPPTAEPTDPPATEVPTDPPEPTDDPVTPAPSETPAPLETPVPTANPTVLPTEPPNEDSPVCTVEREHPVLMALAVRFEVPYEELVGYFCVNNWGVGEIALALTTLQNSDGAVDLPALMAQRLEDGLGWGQIWQNLGLSGQDHGGVGLLKKDQDRNQHHEQIANEGEDSEILNQASHRSQKDKPLNSPPGQEKQEAEGSVEFVPPGQEGKTDDGKPGNGPKH